MLLFEDLDKFSCSVEVFRREWNDCSRENHAMNLFLRNMAAIGMDWFITLEMLGAVGYMPLGGRIGLCLCIYGWLFDCI